MTTALEPVERIRCPACSGTGTIEQFYPFKPRHQYDYAGSGEKHVEACPVCAGEGSISPSAYEAWRRQQRDRVVCPVCGGNRGKRSWSWDESNHGLKQQFTLEPCALCGGEGWVLPQVRQTHEREKQRIRLWGVGCTLVAVVGGIWMSTTILSLILGNTPLLMCCPPPQALFSLIVVGVVAGRHRLG
jgi:hypothetical protein